MEEDKRNENNRPDLTVLVAVYNHRSYLRQCIDSIRMQKVNFTMEVLIGEDCSTDGSRQILKKMERAPDWPRNFHVLYREKNLGMWENGTDLYRRARGRYLIVLEGDDYWTYPYKLQRQYDFLERHPEYSGAAHRVLVVQEDEVMGSRSRGRDRIRRYRYPECRHRIYSIWDWTLFRLPGQTASLMFRNYPVGEEKRTDIPLPDGENRMRQFRDPWGYTRGYPRDQQKALFLVLAGPIRCFPETWSAYRYHPETGTSFSGGEKVPWAPRRAFYRDVLRMKSVKMRQKCLICARFLLEGLAVWYNQLIHKAKPIKSTRGDHDFKE